MKPMPPPRQVTLVRAGPGHTRTHSCVLAVLNPNVPRVVVGKGKTATLPFTFCSFCC